MVQEKYITWIDIRYLFSLRKREVNIFSNKLGFIGPNPLIFDGTLMSNIQYGNENKLDEEVVIEYLKRSRNF